MAGLDLPARVGRNDAQNARRRCRCQLPRLCFAAEGQPCFVQAGIIAAVQHRKCAAFRQRHCVCRRGLWPDGDADRIGIRRFADDALPIVLPVGDGKERLVGEDAALADAFAVEIIHGGVALRKGEPPAPAYAAGDGGKRHQLHGGAGPLRRPQAPFLHAQKRAAGKPAGVGGLRDPFFMVFSSDATCFVQG